MKKILTLLLMCSIYSIISCSKSNSDLPDSEVIASNDTKSGGIYKGVIIGSSGTIKIILQGSTASATVTIDGKTKVLPATNLQAGWTSGGALTNLIFSADNWTVKFTVSFDGSRADVVDIAIPGHSDIEVYIVKETSTRLIKVYEGTYGNGASSENIGAFNFVTSPRDSALGIYKSITGNKLTMYGQLDSTSNQILLFGLYEPIVAEAKLRNNEYSGTWKKEDYSGNNTPQPSGHWKAKRTL